MQLRPALGFLLLACAVPAAAEWTRVYENKEAVSYVDPPTIRKEGELRRVWRLQDLKQAGPKGERSIRALMQVDCKEERQRIVAFTFHSGPMATGKQLVHHDASGGWDFVAPNTGADAVLRFVCDK